MRSILLFLFILAYLPVLYLFNVVILFLKLLILKFLGHLKQASALFFPKPLFFSNAPLSLPELFIFTFLQVLIRFYHVNKSK